MAADQTLHPEPPQAPDDAHLDRVVEPEYAAISANAIGALVLAGIAAVAFLPLPVDLPLPGTWMKFPVLLALPLATIPYALAAIRGIRNSEGTRVGLGLAHAALVLAVVIVLGAGTVHALRIRRHHTIEQSLVHAADPLLQAVIDDDFQSLFDNLARGNPEIAKRRAGYQNLWRHIQAYLHTDGGDYYGRHLRLTQILPPENPELPPYDRGDVVHRFRFTEGAMDIAFQFWRVDGTWTVMGFYAKGQLVDYPKPGETPAKRFDP